MDEDFEYVGVVGYNPKGQKTIEKSFDSEKKAEMFFNLMPEEEEVENVYFLSAATPKVANFCGGHSHSSSKLPCNKLFLGKI